MRTVKWNPVLSGTCMFLGGVLLWAGAARADVSTTNSAAILVYPKLLVDTTAAANSSQVDTVLELTNTSADPINVRCFLVNANGHCSLSPFAICDPDQATTDEGLHFADPATCGKCIPSWVETDFKLRLTSKQPIVWTASDGLVALPLDPTFTNNVPGNGQFNTGSIPPAPEIPFRGELKCIEVGDDESPVAKNDLKGEATIELVAQTASGNNPLVDIEGYNAIGIQAIPGDNFNGDNTLVIGQEYNSCPNLLILDHFFDGAPDPTVMGNVSTALTIVPCSEDFNFQAPNTTVVQYLVYNEFEQRFSTSNRVTCFSEKNLSDIDTHLGSGDDNQSIFNFAVEGTLTGQTVIRGVADAGTTAGHGLLAIAEEEHETTIESHGAFNLHQRGTRTQSDIIQLPGVPTDATP
jgi:hypothetical protein